MAPVATPGLRPDTDGSFEVVYRDHVRDVYGFSLGMLGNAEDAEDVAQTTFLNAYRALKRGERVRNPRAWLLAIAHNVCRQRFRTASRRPQEVELDPEAAEAFRDEDAPTAEEIRHAMSELSFNQRTVLVLREIEGLSYEEIGEAMELSLSAVETLLFRARQALREQLEAAEHDLGCDAVERLISLQLDGKLTHADRGLLRAHLRSCPDCARIARSQRARKRVMPSLIALPLPTSLAAAVEGGGIGLGVFGSKAAAVAVSAALIGAGALVKTGVVPTPGKEQKAAPAASAGAGAEASLPNGGGLFTPLALMDFSGRLAPANAKPTPKPISKNGKNRKDGAEEGSGQKVNGGGSDPAGSGTVGPGSAAPSPGVGQGVVLPPPAPSVPSVVSGATTAVDNATKATTDAVKQAQSKIPPLLGSPGVQPPSIPPVPPLGMGSLP